MTLEDQWIDCNVRRLGGPFLIEPEELAKAACQARH